jgi:hypothetical protein
MFIFNCSEIKTIQVNFKYQFDTFSNINNILIKIGKILLKSNKNNFERGSSDFFEIKTSDVGNLRKIKIGHDARGLGSGWFFKIF